MGNQCCQPEIYKNELVMRPAGNIQGLSGENEIASLRVVAEEMVRNLNAESLPSPSKAQVKKREIDELGKELAELRVQLEDKEDDIDIARITREEE
jgi:hypothetical protein